MQPSILRVLAILTTKTTILIVIRASSMPLLIFSSLFQWTFSLNVIRF